MYWLMLSLDVMRHLLLVHLLDESADAYRIAVHKQHHMRRERNEERKPHGAPSYRIIFLFMAQASLAVNYFPT